jgi:hypothetical protein
MFVLSLYLSADSPLPACVLQTSEAIKGVLLLHCYWSFDYLLC